MDQSAFPEVTRHSPEAIPLQMRRIEGRQWWLSGFTIAVTLALTLGIVSFTVPGFHWMKDSDYWFDLREWVRGLAAMVLLFDFYTIYQHLQLQRIRRQLAERDQLFELISENAADMIALVARNGTRLYNSPAYQKVLGYSSEDLNSTSSFDQIHPDDRLRVSKAAEKAFRSGHGETMEYRIRHKDGSWRILESTANPIRDASGQTDKLVIVNRDITERKRAEDLLAHSAFHDGLTDLPNRALFLDRLQHALTLSKAHANYKFAVLLIDVDEFKVVNDSLGHAVGDELLIKIGERLKSAVGLTDTVAHSRVPRSVDTPINNHTLARLGGDEFTILLDDIRGTVEAVRFAEYVQSQLAAPFVVDRREIVISASIGIAESSSPHTQAEDILRDADIAMYRAKGRGRAHCEVFDTAMHGNAVQRLTLETDIRKALDQGEFEVYYQPIVSLQTARITGFEALTRWRRPQGMVSPADFIPVAEETGLIIPMNRLLLREACQHLLKWQSQFPANPPLSMSVNLTSKEFAQPDLATEIGKTLADLKLDPWCLQLEIIETIAMGDTDKSGLVLGQLRDLGIRLAIDDFGTGYSSLSRLGRIPVDTVKIDRSFISKMESDLESREIVRAIIMLAHNLGLKVVAEGTETERQIDQLKQLNCEMAQGYFFARPTDHHGILKLLAATQLARTAAAGH
jgi:PAS domain S-box-containing protein